MKNLLRIFRQVTSFSTHAKPQIVALILLFSGTAFAEESFVHLKKRVKFNEMTTALQQGDNRAFSILPARGYSNGLTGIMIRYDVYPNPEYSFTSCGAMDKIVGKAGFPGCVVSLKLARKLPNGNFYDIGIRIEYAIATDGKVFEPNNSVYAQHAVTGNGRLDSQLSR